MNRDELLVATRKLISRVKERALAAATQKPGTLIATHGTRAEVQEFLRVYAGPHSEFFSQATKVHSLKHHELDELGRVLESFLYFIDEGWHSGISPKRTGQLDVVNDLLVRAHEMLENDDHPAMAAMIIGATLEQFLRSWAEAEGLTVIGRPGIDSYGEALVKAGFLDKQGKKELTVWAGLRNDAAHGSFEKVDDKKRVGIMLDGVNLFLQQHTPK